jgi:hypothetical protein
MSIRQFSSWRAPLLGALMLSACQSSETQPRTEVLLQIDADSQVRARAEHLTIELASGAATAGALTDAEPEVLDVNGADFHWPASLALVAKAGHENHVFEVVITADAQGRPLTRARVRSAFLKGQTLLLTTSLVGECIEMFDCAADQTCVGAAGAAACVASLVDQTLLPTFHPNGNAGMSAADGGDAGSMTTPDSGAQAQAGSAGTRTTTTAAGTGATSQAGSAGAPQAGTGAGAADGGSGGEPCGKSKPCECVPAAVRCVDEQRLEHCDDTGHWQPDRVCDSGCRQGATVCSVCAPESKRCDGRKPQICRQDGALWLDNGALCGSDCVAGVCPTCGPGDAPRCQANVVEECVAVDVWQVRTECGGATPACVMGQCKVCSPNATRCIGTTLEVCNADGSAWQMQAVEKDVCGAQCLPGSQRCYAQVFQRCDKAGGWSDPAITVGECGVVCRPGEQSCAGTLLRTCNDSGSGWLDNPIKSGVCNAECNPGETQCNATQTRSCTASGQWSALAFTPPSCGAVCMPGNVRCSGTTSQVCSADASVWKDQPPQAGTCDCNKPAPPGFGGACGSCGGVVQCDGTCSHPTPNSYGQSCGSCGGTVQCDGTCSVATPGTYGQSCGSCGGRVQCDGTCSVATPGSYGQSCGSCGGNVQCDGTCSVATPASYGQSCGSCGGKVQCDGACSVATPASYGQSCGSCGGNVQCDGTCSVATPADLGQACGSCGGQVLCDSSCSIATPPDLGAACGSCGGTIQCGGGCSAGKIVRSCSGRCCEYDGCGNCVTCAAVGKLCP